MTLAEFKQSYAVSSIGLYQSKSSNRLVGTLITSKGERTAVTTETFDSKAPVFVYPTEVTDETTGEVSELIVLSNKQPATPAVTL